MKISTTDLEKKKRTAFSQSRRKRKIENQNCTKPGSYEIYHSIQIPAPHGQGLQKDQHSSLFLLRKKT